MAVNLTGLMNCSYGSAGLMITAAKYTETPTVTDGAGRIFTHALFEGEGFFDADNLTDFNNRLASIQAAFRVDGQPFTVTQFGGTAPLVSLLPGQVLDGGPFCQFEIRDGDGPLHRLITFSLRGRLALPAVNTFKFGSSVTPDGLNSFRQTGTVAGALSSLTFDGVLSGWLGTYAAPNFITSYSYERNPGSDLFTYSFTARQTADPMDAGGGATAVEGERTVKFEVDEQHRKTTVYDYDYLIVGDPVAFHQSLRSQISDPTTIYRESYGATAIKGIRVRSSFTVITGADANSIVSFTETVTFNADQPQFEPHYFVGAAPIAVLKPTTFGTVTQSGSAVSVGIAAEANDPIPTVLTELPKISVEAINSQETRTTWHYEGLMVNADGSPLDFGPADVQWDNDLDFYTEGEGP